MLVAWLYLRVDSVSVRTVVQWQNPSQTGLGKKACIEGGRRAEPPPPPFLGFALFCTGFLLWCHAGAVLALCPLRVLV